MTTEQNDTDALRELVEKLQVELHANKILIAELLAKIEELEKHDVRKTGRII